MEERQRGNNLLTFIHYLITNMHPVNWSKCVKLNLWCHYRSMKDHEEADNKKGYSIHGFISEQLNMRIIRYKFQCGLFSVQSPILHVPYRDKKRKHNSL